MNRYVLACIASVLVLSGCAAPRQEPIQYAVAEAEDYKLGIGDVISIRVFGGEEDLRFERVRLNDRGPLTLPFGDFAPHGRTTRELESAIRTQLTGQYLRNPRVWVNIDEYRPFFMQGQVARPGAYPYQPGMTVGRAITIAGGFRERAAKDKMSVVRDEDKTGRPARVNLNSPVKPGDTITVEESFF